jgi:DNA-directed RNA polymerase specialized sigma24 family protein
MTDDVERKKNEIFPVRLAEAYQNNLDMLIQTAYWVVKDRQHAEAVVHDVIERLLRSGPPPDFDKNPRGYLYRAVFNQGISFSALEDPIASLTKR